MSTKLVGVASIIILLGLAANGHAQETDKTRWGVNVGWAPWQVPSQIDTLFDVESLDVKGADIQIGIQRGKIAGGDWGVAYVRKTLSSDSTVVRSSSSWCLGGYGCVDANTTYVAKSMRLHGVKVHKFFNFGVIRNRVQIGLNLAGGVASISGDVEKREQDLEYTYGPTGIPTSIGVVETTEVVSAEELFGSDIKAMPLLDLQLGVGVIVSPSLKLKILGGLNFPGYQFASVNLVYLFGKR